MGLINTELEKLKSSDILSFILFVLFKLRESNEYSAISELAYILDKENLFRLCEYFGGLTITIPTVDDLETLLNSLLLYKYVDIDQGSFESAFNNLKDTLDKVEIKKCYLKIRELLSEYNISNRGKI
jgi:hypothetical protein